MEKSSKDRRIDDIARLDRARYEHKFVVSATHKTELLNHIKMHTALFREAYPLRQVNNIYLDTLGFHNYFENVDGIRDRVKARIRWYGELIGSIERPVLELKIKKGQLGWKDSYRLVPFQLDDGFESKIIAEIFAAADLPDTLMPTLRPLQPVLLNSYQRLYFISADGNFRVTVDDQLRYHRIGPNNNALLHSVSDPEHIVIEIKYDQQHRAVADGVTAQFPLHMTKNSKYANGISSLYVN